MVLFLTLLVFAMVLGLVVGRVGLGVYVALFVFAAAASVAFLSFYSRLPL